MRAPFVALTALLRRRFPDVDDPVTVIRQGDVLVSGAVIANPRAQVRIDARIQLLQTRPLRGTVKLSHALDAFGLDLRGLVALDLGAAAGGFTLLDAGIARVFAVDAGVGQLRGSLRLDPRVVNLERTNLAELDARLIDEPVDLITMDLSYLAVADAAGQLGGVMLSAGARMIALVKPTFELHASSLHARPEEVADAVMVATTALSDQGWEVVANVPSPIRGSNGAVEHFLYARRWDCPDRLRG
jgi:23S rRNA (cytidine1920-2'-O)/16S rRNA (cytidine1409-2'-O)-methyltransferase